MTHPKAKRCTEKVILPRELRGTSADEGAISSLISLIDQVELNGLAHEKRVLLRELRRDLKQMRHHAREIIKCLAKLSPAGREEILKTVSFGILPTLVKRDRESTSDISNNKGVRS